MTAQSSLENKSTQRKYLRIIPEGSPLNEVEETFIRRRSIRKYKKKQVPEYMIRRILEVARYAPSQGNCQPWRFIVIRDREMILAMEESAAKIMVPNPDAPPPNPDPPPGMHPVPYRFMTRTPADAKPGGLFWHAPTVILPLMDKRGIGHPEIDLGIVGTNIVMAAHSLGLGTCWVGFTEILNGTDWPKKLGIEEPYRLIEAITVGFPAGRPEKNMIQRETQKITWFEGGEERTIY